MQNEVQLKIKGRNITIAVDGLTEMEIEAIARQVEKKMDDIEKKSGQPDTSKLATLAAMEFAIELHNLRHKLEGDVEAEGRAIDGMTAVLEGALDKKLF